MRKGRDGESGEKKKMKKIMAEIVATNVVASRPPERRPTATPTARANYRVSDVYPLHGWLWGGGLGSLEGAGCWKEVGSKRCQENYWDSMTASRFK